ncbi:Coronin-7 [Nowakowskiella sp. JEL0407]|nr:Coronin-7 [Nowakowskiella sp. JEL0407]
MAFNRFKTSKYRNAVFACKKDDIYSLPSQYPVALSNDFTSIAASRDSIAYPTSLSSIAMFNILPTGRLDNVSIVNTPCPFTSLTFSPFNDDILATAGEDGNFRFWNVNAIEPQQTPILTLGGYTKRIESINFFPASNVICALTQNNVDVWDTTNCKKLFEMNHPDLVQSFSFRDNGAAIVTTCKDKNLRIFDPRSSVEAQQQTASNSGIKPSKAIWLGNTDLIFTTGFSTRRDREWMLFDSRNLKEPLNFKQIDNSSGIISPLFDCDTGMLYLVGKGDSTLRWLEVSGTTITDGVLSYSSHTTFSGGTLIPKLAVNVMQGEVARIMLPSSDGTSIMPVSVTVPRRSYIDFHADIFPDTYGETSGMSCEQWKAGENNLPPFVSLDPKLRKNIKEKAIAPTSSTSSGSSPPAKVTAAPTSIESPPATKVIITPPVSEMQNLSVKSEPTIEKQPVATLPTRAIEKQSTATESAPVLEKSVEPESKKSPPTIPAKPAFVVPKQSSYRFTTAKGTVKYEGVHGLSISHPSESNIIEVCKKFTGLEMNFVVIYFFLPGV